MDWQGQKVAEQLMQIMLVAFAAVAFFTGYTFGSFQLMILVYAGGVVLTALIIIPNWPFFNRHPLNWLDPSEADRHPKPQHAASSKKKSTKHNNIVDSEFVMFGVLSLPFFFLLPLRPPFVPASTIKVSPWSSLQARAECAGTLDFLVSRLSSRPALSSSFQHLPGKMFKSYEITENLGLLLLQAPAMVAHNSSLSPNLWMSVFVAPI
ncbi:hypothetical protein Ancab_019015 [Ancistrocladus abbreviatus]